MAIAGFEASTRSPTVALSFGDRTVERALTGGRPHASDLLATLGDLLSEASLTPADLEWVVVGTGPGSFTGLRVATAAALGLARGSGAKLFGVPSAEVLLWRELAVGEVGAQLLDARQGEVYLAVYRRRIDALESLVAPCVLRPEELAARVPHDARCFAEAGLEQSPALDEGLRRRLRVDASARASSLIDLARRRFASEGAHGIAQLEPLYLKPFAAKRARP